jgi:hypothetical protein
MSGSALSIHPTTVALVQTVVRLAESTLWREHLVQLDKLRAHAAPMLAAAGGPAIAVDIHGWVVAASGIAVPERIAPPKPINRCSCPAWDYACRNRSERVGWSAAEGIGQSSNSNSTLGRRREQQCEEMWIGHAPCRRDTQILQLLVNSQSVGIDALSLSEALFGDREHVGAVRAEVSRLRKSLGPVLTTQPYRFADS